jgi:endoglucanase
VSKYLFIALFLLAGNLFGQNFNKGVNLSGWFQAATPRQIQFKMFTKTDFEQIKSLGCDVVRLPINLHAMTNGAPNYTLDPLFLNMLDQVVNWSEELNIHLILDNHTFDPAVSTPASIADPLVKVWTQMAQHYANRSQFLYYEVLNEPHGIDASTWGSIQQSVINAIRVHDAQHYIIVGGVNWNSYTTLESIPVYTDSKLIYTFHFYDPFIFTHQGASWTDPSMVPLTGVPFPYGAAAMPGTPASLRGTWIESAMNNYSNEGTIAKVRQLIDIAVAFKVQRNVPVFCGELGVFIPNSNQNHRVAWYEQVRNYLNQKGISWTTWDYKGGFGLFEKNSNELFEYDLNVPLLEALNFTVPEQQDFVQQPNTTGFVMYDDYIGEDIVNASSAGVGVLDFYSENQPSNGDYCLYWTGVGQYDPIGFDFRPNLDLSELKEHDFELVFKARGNSPSAKFDVRFIDTKTSTNDHPWRMGITLDNSILPMDGQWHEVRIPLGNLVEKGSWDNAWFNPQSLFDWTSIDRFEIVPEHQPLAGIEFSFDDVAVVGEEIILGTEEKSQLMVSVFPNPANENLTIEFQNEDPAQANISIFNVMGEEIHSVESTIRGPGKFQAVWSCENKSGKRVPAGLYLIKVRNHSASKLVKVVVR